MKKVKTIALLSAVCISSAAFTGCYEIPEALMYASAPHISEDSELITESMKIKEKYYDKNYAMFKPDKSVKSRVSEISDIINSGNYTLKTYFFSDGYYSDFDCYESDYLTYPENEIDTDVSFEKAIVSNKDSWTISGYYYINKDQKPVIDKKTFYGAYEEDIIKDGYEYYRYDSSRTFYMYTPDEFGYRFNMPQTYYDKSIVTGKAAIDGVEYDAEIVSYEEYYIDEHGKKLYEDYYEDSEEYQEYDDYYDDYYDYYLLIYDDENNLTIRAILDPDEAELSAVPFDLDYADYLIYEKNDDNSSLIKKPEKYLSLDEDTEYSDMFIR